MTKLRVLTALFAVIVFSYLGDSLLLRWRGQPLGTVAVERYDAIPEKNGKTEFAYDQPINQPCVHALFPHRGYQPCWYLTRHSEQRVDY
jgi:hypothetical protein